VVVSLAFACGVLAGRSPAYAQSMSAAHGNILAHFKAIEATPKKDTGWIHYIDTVGHRRQVTSSSLDSDQSVPNGCRLIAFVRRPAPGRTVNPRQECTTDGGIG
jgi:hypothetical protein